MGFCFFFHIPSVNINFEKQEEEKMSWIGGSFVIKDASKKELERAKAIVTSHVRHNADLEEFPNMGCSLPFKVKNDKVFDSFNAAEEYSDNIFAQWNRKYHLVVPFKDTSEAKETKKIQDLKRRIKETEEKSAAYFEAHKVSNLKAAYIGCQKCGSKINKDYLKSSNRCLVCGQDLRSETTKKMLASYEKKMKDLRKQMEEEKSKQKVPVRYAVFFCDYVG